MMQPMQLLPKYEIEKVEDVEVKRTLMVSVKDKEGKHLHFKREEKTIEGGYVAYFPQGHSLFVESAEELKRLGLSEDPGLVDMNSGEEVPENFMSLKSRVRSKTRNVVDSGV